MNIKPYLYLLATAISPGNLPQAKADQKHFIEPVLNIVFTTIGALALVFITASGLRYILAGADPQKAAQAKNGIIYSLVGLAVAITARALVSFIGNQV